MILIETASELFGQIKNAVSNISGEQYTQKSRLLNQATVGQHLRHVIELFQELLNGYACGTIDYENRERSMIIENDPSEAFFRMDDIIRRLEMPDKELLLRSDYSIDEPDPVGVKTNFHREIIYNLEHTIHHMALMRIAIEKEYGMTMPETFGLAPSTIKYRQACAQ